MILYILYELIGVFLHIEEVRLLLCLLYGCAAIGAFAVNYLCVGKEGLAGGAIPALVISLVDIALLQESFKYLLYCVNVIIVGGAHKVVVAYVHLIPDTADNARYVINVRLRRDACGGGVVLDLLSVLIGTRAEENVVSPQSSVACNGVGSNSLVGVAYMGLCGCVCYCGSDIVFRFIHSQSLPFCLFVILFLRHRRKRGPRLFFYFFHQCFR